MDHTKKDDTSSDTSGEAVSSGPGRRAFIAGAAGAVAAATLLRATEGVASAGAAQNLAATPPEGFTPFSAPGTVIKVTKTGSLQENGRYPKPEDALAMLEKVMTELTGKPDLKTAVMQFVHPKDKVCVKVNGIAQRNMSTNKELVIPFLQAMVDGGVKPENITVLEQYGGFLSATRITQDNVPKGVKLAFHANGEATMEPRKIPTTPLETKFTRFLTESTAVINFALVKDHSMCGYTGAIKNMTHGCIINPSSFHRNHDGNTQIATIYAQDVIRSRVRLNIADAFKVMAHGGPLWASPQHVKTYEAVMASTDPVAIDTIGWEIVAKMRAEFGLKPLHEDINPNNPRGRDPGYIALAGQLGLGISDRSKINLRELTA